MKLTLIDGVFSAQDAAELISQMFSVKIKFHEQKISQSTSEEDIKFRENKIKNLQKELHEFREVMKGKVDAVSIQSLVNLA